MTLASYCLNGAQRFTVLSEGSRSLENDTQSNSGPSWPNTLTRQGRQALYTFTPFKLLRARGHSGYSVLLAPLHKLQVTPSFRWRSASSKSSFRVPLTDTWAKRVYQPHQLY